MSGFKEKSRLLSVVFDSMPRILLLNLENSSELCFGEIYGLFWNLQSTGNSIPFHSWWQERFERFQTFHHCLFVSFILPSFVFMIVWITPKSHQKEICEWFTEFWKRWEEHTVCSFYSQSCLFVSLILVLHCTLLAHTMMEFLEVLGEERVNERRRVCLTSVFQCVRPSSSVFEMTS